MNLDKEQKLYLLDRVCKPMRIQTGHVKSRVSSLALCLLQDVAAFGCSPQLLCSEMAVFRGYSIKALSPFKIKNVLMLYVMKGYG